MINEEICLGQITNADVMLQQIQRVTDVEMINGVKKMKLGKVAVPSEMNTEVIVASSKIGMEFMMELCQRVLDGKGISAK